MMRVFLYEYTCAAAAPGQISTSLAAEGRAMWQALVHDFAEVPGVEVVTQLHPEFGPVPAWKNVHIHRSAGGEDTFRTLARRADTCLVIAPEFDQLLATRCRWVLEAGSRLLGPAPEAVTLAADKLALSRHFRARGIPTPATVLAADFPGRADLTFPVVSKPRFGAGSQATVLANSPAELTACAAILQAELPGQEAIVQPFVPGLPASVALLIGPHQQSALLPATQQLSDDSRFRYRGGSLPLPPELAARAIELGRQATATIAELRGYVGVDLILGAAADGSEDCVIEINPRLTTSYLGLRALARTNLALAMLQIADGRDAILSWQPGSVQFSAAGKILAITGVVCDNELKA
jgi:predicted ATP-grasp superfamily ATP-dependent carboligase